MRKTRARWSADDFGPAERAEIARWEGAAAPFGWKVTRVTRGVRSGGRDARDREAGPTYLALLHAVRGDPGSEAVFFVRHESSFWFLTGGCRPAAEATPLKSLRDALEMVCPTLPQASMAIH